MCNSSRLPLVILLACVLVLAHSAAGAGEKNIPVTTSSKEALGLFLKGRQLADNLRLTDAHPLFMKALEADPDFALAYLFAAQTSSSGKEFFANLEKATSLSGKASKGEALWIMGTRAGALADPEAQRRTLTELAGMYPDDERAQMLLGIYYFGIQQYDQAAKHLKRSTDIAPDFAPAYNQLGYAYRFLGKYEAAEATFRKYTELIPDDPNPYDSYAELLLKIGRYEDAITQYTKALAVNKEFANSYAGIAAAQTYQGKYDEALGTLDRALGVARNDGEKRAALFTRAVVCADKGEMSLALKELDRQYAIAAKSNDAAGMAGDLVAMGNILLEKGDADEALTHFAKAKECIKTSSLAKEVKENAEFGYNYNASRAMLAKHSIAEATSFADQVRKGSEAKKNLNQIKLAHELSGLIALSEKKPDVAITELEQSNLQNPYNLFTLAHAYAMSGNPIKAKATMEQAAKFSGLPALNYAFIRVKAEQEWQKM
jgi:tetratricopeptide (TPR) repeat protein